MMVDTDKLIPEDAERIVMAITRSSGNYLSLTHRKTDFETARDSISENPKTAVDEIVEVVVLRRAVVRRTAFADEVSAAVPAPPDDEDIEL